MTESISQKVLEKIIRENIKIKSRAKFIFDTFIWRSFALFSLIVSSIFFGYAFYYFENTKISLLVEYPIYILLRIPFLSLVAGLVLVSLSSSFYRKSRICFQNEEWMLLSALLFIAVALSFIITRTGVVSSWYQALM